MRVTRVYCDEAGDSHFDDKDIELHDAGAIGRLSEPIAATSVIFRTNDRYATTGVAPAAAVHRAARALIGRGLRRQPARVARREIPSWKHLRQGPPRWNIEAASGDRCSLHLTRTGSRP
jgi:hypothetical protein